MTAQPGLGWISIIRLGAVQSCLGAVVALTTSTLNRVMVVEMALPAVLPALLVALHYGVQISRPRWGYGSDIGGRRTPWIVAGMGLLCLGALGATDAALIIGDNRVAGIVLSVISYILIGVGVGASGTSLLAFLATRTAPERRPAAASITWIMMILGIVISAIAVGAMIEPFSAQALALAASAVCAVAFLVTLVAVWGMERTAASVEDAAPARETRASVQTFRQALAETWREPTARAFAIFVFVAMLAYSAQDLILEPFAGLVFGFSPGQSTQLAGVQNGGVLLGMILTGVFGARSARGKAGWMREWTVFGCLGSAVGLAMLAVAASVGPGWPLQPTVFGLGFANGVFAVAAIGSMMGLAGSGQESREGTRMGLWGAAQAIAFGLGGFLGAAGVDVLRALLPGDAQAFLLVFSAEAALFCLAALLAARLTAPSPATERPLIDPRAAGAIR